MIEEVVAVQEGILAEGHPDRLASRHVLAGAYQANGQIGEAIELLEEVVMVEEGTLAKNHPDRLASRHARAVIYSQQGYHRERESTRSTQ